MRMMSDGEVKLFFYEFNEMLESPGPTKLSRARFLLQEAQERLTDDALVIAWRRLAICWEIGSWRRKAR